MQKKSKLKLQYLKLNNATSLLFLMLNQSMNTFLDSVMCKQSLCLIFFRSIIFLWGGGGVIGIIFLVILQVYNGHRFHDYQLPNFITNVDLFYLTSKRLITKNGEICTDN